MKEQQGHSPNVAVARRVLGKGADASGAQSVDSGRL